MISFYSSQMVVTVNTTKYTNENDLTKKEEKKGTRNRISIAEPLQNLSLIHI